MVRRKVGLVAAGAAGLIVLGVTSVVAVAAGDGHAVAGHGEGCGLGLEFGEEAERRAGGAVHEAGHGAAAADAEAHLVHTPQAGGRQLFMAPNKLHHIEPVYSKACGLRVVVYNAYTQPIRAARFLGFVRVVPSLEAEIEHTRFLAPSADGSVLEARLAEELTPPFEIELHMKFPDSEEPQLFNVLVPAQN